MKATNPGPLKTFPIPLTKPVKNVLPASSPPPSAFLIPLAADSTFSKIPPIGPLSVKLPITSASSSIDTVVLLARASNVLFNCSFLIAASPIASPAIAVALSKIFCSLARSLNADLNILA